MSRHTFFIINRAIMKHVMFLPTMHFSGSQGLVWVSTTVPFELALSVVLVSVEEQAAPPLAGLGLTQVRVLVCVLLAVTLLHELQGLQAPSTERYECCDQIRIF